MNQALAGATLRRGEFRLPQLAALDLAGATVREVVPRGKHMLIRLADERTLRTHYRMDGSWHIYRPGARWRGGPGYDVRVVLATDEWECVGYRLHDVEIVPTSRRGPAGRAPRARRPRPRLGPGGGAAPAPLAPRRAGRRRDPRPAQPVRPRQPLQGRVALPLRRAPLGPGGRRGRHARAAGHPRPHPDARQPRPPGAEHHRRPAPRPGPLGLRAQGQALPALPHPDPDGRPGAAHAGAGRPTGARAARPTDAPVDPLARTGEPGRPRPLATPG